MNIIPTPNNVTSIFVHKKISIRSGGDKFCDNKSKPPYFLYKLTKDNFRCFKDYKELKSTRNRTFEHLDPIHFVPLATICKRKNLSS